MLANKSFTIYGNAFVQSVTVTGTTSYTTAKVLNIWDYETQALFHASPKVYPVSSDRMLVNNMLWQRADQVLENVWKKDGCIDSKVDDDWLNDIRSSWDDRLDELYDESDFGE